MFDRFTAEARLAVVLAQEEARRLHHNYIGTEHLLLAITKLPEQTKVLHALAGLGITAEIVGTAIGQVVGTGQEPFRGHIPFTSRAKKVLELSLREALERQDAQIGPEHLMLGILSEGSGLAVKILTQNGRSIEEIRAAVLHSATSPSPPILDHTPAARQALALAQQAAAGAPMGTHHLLEALTRLDTSMAGKTLAALGVTTDAVLAQIDELNLADTSDITPEQAAAATIRWEADEDGARIVTTDPDTVATLRRLAEKAGGTLTGDGPLAGPFIGLHRAIRNALGGIDTALNPPEEPQTPLATLRERLRRRARRS